jgi:predicted transcriptional regulator
MSQATVQEFLLKNKDTWFSSREISVAIGQNMGSVSNNLRRLIKGGFVITKKERSSRPNCTHAIVLYKARVRII